jgi:hypothetical protein
VAVELLLIVAAAELMAYENAPILFELGSINENDASDTLYTPFLGPSVISEIRGRKERDDVTQLPDGFAPNAAAISVPCARVLVLSNALV